MSSELAPPASILAATMAAARRDPQLANADGRPVGRLTEGVTFREQTTYADERGTVVELFDPRWNWHPAPLVFAYSFTIRPGMVKGWNLHQEHEDRYFILQGEMELVLFDPRPESSTSGEVCRIVLSEFNRRIVNVPKCVWHADHNIGTKDVVIVNFPTAPYNHANPDKYRLALDTDLIPYRFANARGGG